MKFLKQGSMSCSDTPAIDSRVLRMSISSGALLRAIANQLYTRPQRDNKIGMFATAKYAQGLFNGNKRTAGPFTGPASIMCRHYTNRFLLRGITPTLTDASAWQQRRLNRLHSVLLTS